jgi:pheromone shutdown protein TraB
MSRVAAMSSALLTKIQADYATKLGVQIGGEFRIAFRMARQQQQLFDEQRTADTPNGCTVILGDRPMKLTLIRAWESLTILSKIRLVLGLIWSCFKQPSEKELKEWIESILNDPNSDILTKSMEELGRTFPTIQQTILTERDQYMACKLLQVTKLMGEATAMDGKKRVIVAIVGVGHCKGMVSLLQSYADMRRNNTCQGDDSGLPLPEQTLQTLVTTKRQRGNQNPEVDGLISDIMVVDSSQPFYP